MKKLALIATAVMTMMAVGCQETLQESLEMTSSEKSVAVEGETSPLSFTASSAWTIASDADWVTFDRTEGEAGDVTVEMTVAANDGYESRTAKVTITMGAKSNVITITQAGRAEFAIETVYNISAEAQTIEFAIESNIDYTYEIGEDAQDWIEAAVDSKAAPVESTLKFDVKENTQTPREGRIYVEAGESIYCLVVSQRGAGDEMAAATAAYLGRSMYFISGSGYQKCNEYAIVLASEDGDTEVTLAINVAEQDDYLATIPSGEYTVDAIGTHAENTFSIKPLDGEVKYYTTIVRNDIEIEVVDGVISVSNVDGVYTIMATLYDATGASYSYIYYNTIETISDASLIAVGGAEFENNYETYYATGANIWDVHLYVSDVIGENIPFLDYISFSISGPAGDISGDELPTGTFTFAEPTTIDSGHPQGNLNVEPNSLMDENHGSNDDDEADGSLGNTCVFLEGSSVTISKNDDGTYNFEFDASFHRYKVVWDDEGNSDTTDLGNFDYNTLFNNVEVSMEYSTSVPTPDADVELTIGSFMGYSGYYLGNKWGVEGCHAFIIYATGLNEVYSMYLPVYIKGDYTYERNYLGVYCNSPLPEGTCTWSETPGENTLLPVVYSSNGTSAAYRYTISNSYTGTTLRPSGGSVTVTSSGLTFDLQASTSDGSQTYHFTGTVTMPIQYMIDHSTAASRYYTLNEWKEHTAAQQ